MTRTEPQRRSRTQPVFDQLAREILQGSYRPGTSLPAERALEAVFKVPRHVVREAFKRLAKAGLVETVKGSSPRVVDFREHAGLELLPLVAANPRGRPEAQMFWLSVLEVRASLGVDVARLCAVRANRAKRQQIEALSQQMRAAKDDASLYELQFRFWGAVQEGASNLVYRLAFNSMIAAANAMGPQAQRWSVRDVRRNDYFRGLAQAIAAGDAELAERRAREILSAGVEEFRRTIHGTPAAAGSGKRRNGGQAAKTAKAR